MKQYKVRYSLGAYSNPNNTLSSFGCHSTNLMGLETVVSAANAGQARQIVESQFGGPAQCQVHWADPIY